MIITNQDVRCLDRVVECLDDMISYPRYDDYAQLAFIRILVNDVLERGRDRDRAADELVDRFQLEGWK